jgi:hypothetical protein
MPPVPPLAMPPVPPLAMPPVPPLAMPPVPPLPSPAAPDEPPLVAPDPPMPASAHSQSPKPLPSGLHVFFPLQPDAVSHTTNSPALHGSILVELLEVELQAAANKAAVESAMRALDPVGCSRKPIASDGTPACNAHATSHGRVSLELGTQLFFKLKALHHTIAGFGYIAGFTGIGCPRCDGPLDRSRRGPPVTVGGFVFRCDAPEDGSGAATLIPGTADFTGIVAARAISCTPPELACMRGDRRVIGVGQLTAPAVCSAK